MYTINSLQYGLTFWVGKTVPQCGTIISTQKVSPYIMYTINSLQYGLTFWVGKTVPQCGTIIPTQKVSPYYIYHQLSIVWTDFLGRENGSTLQNHFPNPKSQPILIPSPLYSIGRLLGLGKRFHIVEPFSTSGYCIVEPLPFHNLIPH